MGRQDVLGAARGHLLNEEKVDSLHAVRHGALSVFCGVRTEHRGVFFLSLSAFVVAAFVSATHDIATDGFYMLALSKEEQALFVGIRATFYRLAMIFASGLLVYMAGKIEVVTGSIPLSWTVVISTAGLVFVLTPLYHTFVLPFPANDSKRSPRNAASDVSFLEIFRSYFKQEKIGAIIAFILLFTVSPKPCF